MRELRRMNETGQIIEVVPMEELGFYRNWPGWVGIRLKYGSDRKWMPQLRSSVEYWSESIFEDLSLARWLIGLTRTKVKNLSAKDEDEPDQPPSVPWV